MDTDRDCDRGKHHSIPSCSARLLHFVCEAKSSLQCRFFHLSYQWSSRPITSDTLQPPLRRSQTSQRLTPLYSSTGINLTRDPISVGKPLECCQREEEQHNRGIQAGIWCKCVVLHILPKLQRKGRKNWKTGRTFGGMLDRQRCKVHCVYICFGRSCLRGLWQNARSLESQRTKWRIDMATLLHVRFALPSQVRAVRAKLR